MSARHQEIDTGAKPNREPEQLETFQSAPMRLQAIGLATQMAEIWRADGSRYTRGEIFVSAIAPRQGSFESTPPMAVYADIQIVGYLGPLRNILAAGAVGIDSGPLYCRFNDGTAYEGVAVLGRQSLFVLGLGAGEIIQCIVSGRLWR